METKKTDTRKFLSLLIGVLFLFSPVFYGIHWKKRNDIQLELYKAIYNQDLRKIKRLVDSGADLNRSNGVEFPDPNGYIKKGISFQAFSSYASNTSAILKIYNEASKNCENTLLAARWVELNSIKKDFLVRHLKILGAKENWHSASAAGNVSFLRSEFKRTGKLVHSTCVFGSPLCLAAMNGKNEAIKFLVKNGSDPNRSDPFTGFKPMYCAIDNGHIKTVKLLLNMKTKIEKNHISMFVLAVMKGHPDLIPIIVKHGPSVTQDEVGSAYNLAVRFHAKFFIGITNPDQGVYLNVIRTLKKEGFDPDGTLPNGQKETALHGAMHYGKEAAIKAMIEVGSNPNIRDATGETPLIELSKGSKYYRRTESERISILNLLVKAGAEVNIRDNANLSPLDHARNNKWKKVEAALISHGAKN